MLVPKKLCGAAGEVSRVCKRLARAEVLDLSSLTDDLVDCVGEPGLLLINYSPVQKAEKHVRLYAIAEAVLLTVTEEKKLNAVPHESHMQLFGGLVSQPWGPLGLMSPMGSFIERKPEFQLPFLRACVEFSPQWDACGPRFSIGQETGVFWRRCAGTLLRLLLARGATQQDIAAVIEHGEAAALIRRLTPEL